MFNQVTETYRVAELAKLVSEMTGVEVANLPNPRQEADRNDLNVCNDQFLALGLKPTTLSEGLMEECTDIAVRHRHRADLSKIIARSVWRSGMATADDLMPEATER
ncbi:nucleoside-diphosphate-sugar epimerase [Catenulispora sp. EB89]